MKEVEGVVNARMDIVKEHIDQGKGLEGYMEKWMEDRGLRAAVSVR